MKISVFYDHILQASEQSGKEVLTLCREVKMNGIDAVEVCLGRLTGNDDIFEYLGDAKIDVSCIYEFYDMAGSDEKEHMERHINVASLVCAKNILVVPGFLDDCDAALYHELTPDYEKLKKFMDENNHVQAMVAGLKHMVDYAGEKGVTVTVEDFDDRKSPLSTMNGVRYFIENVPGLMHTLDCGNYVYSDENVLEAWEILKDSVAHVHCKDRGEEFLEGKAGDCRFYRGLVSVATGEGYLPIKEVLKNLKAVGYDGYLAVEHFDAPGQRECIKRSAEFLRCEWGE